MLAAGSVWHQLSARLLLAGTQVPSGKRQDTVGRGIIKQDFYDVSMEERAVGFHLFPPKKSMQPTEAV